MEENVNNKIVISVVIPIYNEEEVLPVLIRRVLETLEKLNMRFEVIFINDGSRDGSLKLLKEAYENNREVTVINLSRNFGHQVAISAGISHAQGQAAIIMDGDLQDPPSVIPEFIKKWKDGFYVVYGIRRKRKESILKRICYYMFYRIHEKISKIKMPLDSGDFCLMDKVIVDILKSMPERNRFIRGLRSWVGFSQTGVEYDRDSRFKGKSKYGLKKLARLALDGVYSFSDIPLKISLFFGISLFILCFIFALGAIYQRFICGMILGGIEAIIICILFFSSVQLIAIGIMGEYMGRIYDEIKQRPLYIIAQKWFHGDNAH